MAAAVKVFGRAANHHALAELVDISFAIVTQFVYRDLAVILCVVAISWVCIVYALVLYERADPDQDKINKKRADQ